MVKELFSLYAYRISWILNQLPLYSYYYNYPPNCTTCGIFLNERYNNSSWNRFNFSRKSLNLLWVVHLFLPGWHTRNNEVSNKANRNIFLNANTIQLIIDDQLYKLNSIFNIKKVLTFLFRIFNHYWEMNLMEIKGLLTM